jgi:hypothetical protein
MFAELTTGAKLDAKAQKRRLEEMSVDQRRLASAQQQRLSTMLKDIAEGRGDAHWGAAMK